MTQALTSLPALRNRDPILQVLQSQLGEAPGRILEIASGTGEHVAHFAAALPHFDFQPSDIAPERRASIDTHAQGLANIRPAIALDTTTDWTSDLPKSAFAAIVCINMIHIAPWQACLGLLRGSATLLQPGGMLLLYGPYRVNGMDTAPSNADFDADLRRRDPAWGVRDLEAVTEVAASHGFAPPGTFAMPANNLCVLFRLPATQD